MEMITQQPQTGDMHIYNKSSKTVYFLPVILAFLFYTASQPYSDQVSATQK